MLRYKTETRPGLVALYDIRPGNGAGQFLQPRSPHGAQLHCVMYHSHYGTGTGSRSGINMNIILTGLQLCHHAIQTSAWQRSLELP